MRDNKGQFTAGNNISQGRPKGASGVPRLVKEKGWAFVSEIFEKLFVLSEDELIKYVQENRSKMSRAEKVFIDKSTDLNLLQSLLDRVVGLPTKIEIRADIAELPNRSFAFPDPIKTNEGNNE